MIVRKTYPELEQLIADSWKLFPQFGATFEKQPKLWTFPNGATLKFRNFETRDDAERYQGFSYTWLGIDEAGNYATPDVFYLLLATMRAGDGEVPTMRVRLTANPGGVGHHWLKTRYVDPAPRGFTPIKDNPTDVRERMFIPSRITDNKILMSRDPHYIENLKKQASPELIRAWLYGDWDVQISAYYPEFSVARHVLPPHEIPAHAYMFRTFDWGSSHPFAVLWWYVSSGFDLGETHIQRGALVCYREWYGMERGRPNVGVRLRNEEIASGIVRRTPQSERIALTATDSLPFQDRGGPNIAEIFHRNGVMLKHGNTDRVTGWQQLRSRLQGNERGPLIYWVSTCLHSIRTIPALQADSHNLEDVDSDCEDHAADACRLACMERPITRDAPQPKPIKHTSEMTFNELLKYDELHREDD